MPEPASDRFQVLVEDEAPRGGLYELEQVTCYRVVDHHSNEVIMTFCGLLEASLSADTGMWDDFRSTGVRDVAITPDGLAVVAQFADGRVEIHRLPP